MLGGVVVLKGGGSKLSNTDDKNATSIKFTAIPYYSWANRGKGEMVVWLPRTGN
jgi:DUF1680 family protein